MIWTAALAVNIALDSASFALHTAMTKWYELLKRWQRIDQTTKMRHFDLCVSIIGGMAAALVSMDANASGPFVDVRSVDPTITVELRYAGQNEAAGAAATAAFLRDPAPHADANVVLLVTGANLSPEVLRRAVM